MNSNDTAPAATAGAGEQGEDPAKALKELLESMQSRFQGLSESILHRIDEMGNRIDDLEKTIKQLSQKQEKQQLSQPGESARE